MGILYGYLFGSFRRGSGDGDQTHRWARRTVGEAAASAVRSLKTTGIDPNVMLGTLEALLIRRNDAEIVDGPRAGKALAIADDGVKVVQTFTDELQTALARRR
jgi:hypothetical protein